MSTAAVYERLDECEVDRVRTYRRQLWTERAHHDPAGARTQILDALRTHADPWVDGIHLVTITSITMRDVTVGDLTAAQRYALLDLIGGTP